MARTDALSIYINQNTADKLAETYGKVIDAVQKGAISEQIKNKNYSGDPTTGSVEIDRFKNATVNDLGTARTGGAGDKLKNTGKVTVNVDTDKEIVEEIAKKDIKLYGVDGIAEKLEQLIQSVETTQNDWVDGVDRDMLVVTVKPSVYGALLNYIDSVPNSLTGLKDDYFHKVKIYSNHRQTKDMICMIDGAVAQPVVTDQYDAEKIPMSNDIALELFFSKGTKAVMPDLIKFETAE